MTLSRQTFLLRLLTLCLAAGISGVANATEMYRWVDAEGKTHFGDRAPAQNAQSVHIPRSKNPQDGTDRTHRTERLVEHFALVEQFASERNQRETDRAKALQAAEAKKARCREAQDRARDTLQAGYLYDYDEQGRKRVLSDAEHKAARVRVREDAERLCD